MRFIDYNREAACEYARKWAHGRNPAYYDFENLGGDCTNFASQCLFAGVGVMNYTPDVGWFYISPDSRAAAWTEANYFRRFMLRNESVGPYGEECALGELEKGDFISLSDGETYYHTLIVVGFEHTVPLVAAHTYDAYMRRLDSYYFEIATPLHIIGAKK